MVVIYVTCVGFYIWEVGFRDWLDKCSLEEELSCCSVWGIRIVETGDIGWYWGVGPLRVIVVYGIGGWVCGFWDLSLCMWMLFPWRDVCLSLDEEMSCCSVWGSRTVETGDIVEIEVLALWGLLWSLVIRDRVCILRCILVEEDAVPM